MRIYYRPRGTHYHATRTCWAVHPKRSGPIFHRDVRNITSDGAVSWGHDADFHSLDPCGVCVTRTWERSTDGHGPLPDIVVGRRLPHDRMNER